MTKQELSNMLDTTLATTMEHHRKVGAMIKLCKEQPHLPGLSAMLPVYRLRKEQLTDKLLSIYNQYKKLEHDNEF